MIAKIRSSFVAGVHGIPVWIEVDVARGLPHFSIVGLPDSSVRESRDRVRSALRNAGFPFPVARITVNLAPSHIRKAGSAFDLPIALGILIAQGILPKRATDGWVILGELALDGSVRAVRGALCAALDLATEQPQMTRLLVPVENAHEVASLPNVQACAISSLKEAVRVLTCNTPDLLRPAACQDGEDSERTTCIPDPVVGQAAAKRAIEIALAGAHNILLVGPPGSGKTLLGERIPHLLPLLTPTERIEVNRVYSAAGLLDSTSGLITTAPVRAPHHTITTRDMIGGGTTLAPGELSLAHRGVLLLDELALFRRVTLEAMREPVDRGYVKLLRGGTSTTLPCKVSIVATTNPCPCGWLGDRSQRCRCTSAEVMRYRKRLSGPLLDRFDMVLEVEQVEIEEVHSVETNASGRTVESLSAARERIAAARLRQRERHADGELNGHHSITLSDQLGALSAESRSFALRAMERFGLSGRGLHRMLTVARTIADLEESGAIEPAHVAEAVSYRLQFEYGASG